MGVLLQKRLCFITGFLLFISGSSLLGGANAARHYDFVLKETSFTKLCSTKSMLTVNGQFPGPEIRVHKGETVYVNVHNHGLYGVTLHWHGVKQPRNPWSDGPENITQCPIKPGASFKYEINFSSEEGTLWWHAHSDWTRATVHGAIIVYPAAGTTYPFPTPHSEQTIVLASWFKGSVMDIINEALITGGEPNQSDAFTINGQPGDLYPCSNNASTFRLLVNYGKTHLLRIVNSVMNEEMFFAVADHILTVVGSDGAYLKPIETSLIMISPGQTMDVLLTADQTAGEYYMAATAYASGNAEFDNTTTTAIVQYSGNYTPPASPSFPPLPAYNDTAAALNYTSRLRSLASADHPVSVPKNVTERIIITVSVNEKYCPGANCSGPDGNRLSSSLNNISFNTPSIDILQAYYWNISGVFNRTFPNYPPYYFNFTADDTGNNTLFPAEGTEVKMINYNESVEIVFQGTNVQGAAENHPMHLHGFSFYLVGTGFGNYNESSDPQNYNLDDPQEANTIGLPKNGWAAIRFIADNPGVWFMHCHLDRHASWGMETVLIVKNGTTAETSIRPPPRDMPPCS